MNILTLFTEAATIVGDVEIDEASLVAGNTVPLPASVQVGTTGGKPVYLSGDFSTTKPATSGTVFSGGFSILTVLSDAVTIYGDIAVDEAELQTGAQVALPAALGVGSVQGKEVYLSGFLSTTRQTLANSAPSGSAEAPIEAPVTGDTMQQAAQNIT